MITRDFLLRQIHQLVQALATVLLHKRAGRAEDAQAALAEALREATGHDAEHLRTAPREEVLAACASGGAFSAEKAVAVADLLYEDDDAGGRRRALWLYEAALTAGAAVPFDVHERIEALRASGQPTDGRAG